MSTLLAASNCAPSIQGVDDQPFMPVKTHAPPPKEGVVPADLMVNQGGRCENRKAEDILDATVLFEQDEDDNQFGNCPVSEARHASPSVKADDRVLEPDHVPDEVHSAFDSTQFFQGINNTHSKDAPTLGPECPFATVDDHAVFWSTYDRVATTHDRELLDAWNKSLDVLLIFAGLFSAINTAFIMESYKGLQPDPAEVTNNLLRVLISHRNDNITLSPEDLNPVSPATSAVPINIIFFSSLSFSLTAAFGAVTAKQWLTEYNNVGVIKALHIQGRRRQEKYKGLKAWHLRLIIELLPMLLQISLFLFLIGVIHFVWVLDRKVAVSQLVLSGAGLAIYLVTVIIGMVVPTSPFQTPLSKYFPRYFSKIWISIKAIPSLGIAGGLIIFIIEPAGKLPWVKELTAALNNLGTVTAAARKSLQCFIEPQLAILSRWMGFAGDHSESSSGWVEDKGWNPADVTAAESVVWLLEQAEHPDVTITALDAVPRLPPDLLLYLLLKREGLLHRLIMFHNSQLPLPPSKGRDFNWVKAWPNRAIVSGLALWHVLKAKNLMDRDVLLNSLIRGIDTFSVEWSDEWPISGRHQNLTEDVALLITKIVLNCNLNFISNNSQNTSMDTMILKTFSFASEYSYLLPVEFVDTRHSFADNLFTTRVSPFSILLDAITYYPWSSTYTRSETLPMGCIWSLSEVMYGELSRDLVSRIALASAALHWDSSAASQDHTCVERVEYSILARLNEVDKGARILENVGLAFSRMAAVHSLWGLQDPRVFQALLTVTSDLLYDTVSKPDTSITYPELPQNLLRLVHNYGGRDYLMEVQISRVLAVCPDGTWVSPLHEEFGETMTLLLGSILASKAKSFFDIPPTRTPASLLLEKIARITDDIDFLHVIQLPGVYHCHGDIAELMMSFGPPFARHFTARVLSLSDHESPEFSVPFEIQVLYVVAILSIWEIQQDWDPICDLVVLFFNRMLKEDAELHWPSFFISMGLISGDMHNNNADHPTSLKSIEPRVLESIAGVLFAESEQSISSLWVGEALLLLWTKVRQEHANGRFPSDWNDSIFFKRQTKIAIGRYCRIMQEVSFSGTDLGRVEEYFNHPMYLPE